MRGRRGMPTAQRSRATTTSPCTVRPERPALESAPTGKPIRRSRDWPCSRTSGPATHTSQGRYADNVARGLDFLLSEQKRDGDLRGRSRVVGMYCHAMATLALCEAYALSGDARLRDPAERAVAFMVSARAADGMAWRYAPGAPAGDTSILGWVVMGLKSAREIGIPIPEESIGAAGHAGSGSTRLRPGKPKASRGISRRSR